MKEEFNNIDNLFKRQVKDFSPDVPDGAWENIAMALANTGKSKKMPLFFWKIAAGVALLLGSATLGTYLFIHKPNAGQIAEQTNIESSREALNQDNNENIIGIPKETASGANAINSSGSEISDNYSNKAESKSNKKEIIAFNTDIKSNPKNNIPALKDNAEFNSDLTADKALNQQDSYTGNNNLTSENNEKSDQIANKEAEDKNDTDVVSEIQKENNNSQNFVWQNEDDAVIVKEKKENLWSIGGQAGPQYTYRTISSEINAQELLDMSDRDESGTIAYAAGVHVEYKPARRFSIQSGIYYSKYSTEGPVTINVPSNNFDSENPTSSIDRVNTNELIVKFPNASVDVGEANTVNVAKSNSNVYGTPTTNLNELIYTEDVPEYTTSVRNYEYIEIPVIARYAIIDRKINLDILGGISTNVLINNNIEIDFPVDLPTNYESKNINTLNYSSTLGLGFGYDITKNISLSFEPQFKYFLSSQSYSRNNVRPYSLGVYSGIKYLF